jgi:type IV secretion system protein VirD4
MKPISVYLSVNQVDARALSVITGIFVELMSSFLIANPPNFVGSDGMKTGPFPTMFVLDEFPQMPKLAAVKDGPAVGRGQKVSYLLIGQDLGQISGQYGKDDLETIITTTAAKVILAQNNEQTAERFSKMIGTKTIETKNISQQEMFGFNPKLSANVSTSLQSAQVVGASEMMSLDMMKQYVIFQGFLNRPILADAPRWYMDKSMKKKCSLPASPFVPYWIVAQRENTELDAMSTSLQESLEV